MQKEDWTLLRKRRNVDFQSLQRLSFAQTSEKVFVKFLFQNYSAQSGRHGVKKSFFTPV